MQNTKPIYIVSGLPRSGTSLMMQMLYAGGLPVSTDGKREADSANPKGYFELEAVKRLDENPGVLFGVQGKAVKILLHLLHSLSKENQYKIILMRRNLAAVIQSQNKMLAEKDIQQEKISPLRLAEIYSLQLTKTKDWLCAQKIPYLEVWYEELLKNPEKAIDILLTFLDIPLERQAMLAVTDSRLNHFSPLLPSL